MTNRYPRIYKALKQIGFSPAKAAEVILDASRGDAYARSWTRLAWIATRPSRKT